jgi:hypothetical protein
MSLVFLNMEPTDSTPKIIAKTAYQLVSILAETARVLTEPAKITRVALAQAEATKILTEAEIDREALLAEAGYRTKVVEIFRQQNIESIAAETVRLKGDNLAIEDKDWLVGFIESCKDTSDPALQSIWAKLLAGEMEATGSCSKRTLQMVKYLSRDEALLIKDICRRVCIVEEANGNRIAFLNVLINRLELDFDADHPLIVELFKDESPDFLSRNRRLISCGFLSNDDFKFNFNGEGRLDPAFFQLSEGSPKRIIIGEKSIVAGPLQPHLLFNSRRLQLPEPRIRTPAATIEFDAWRLSAEGEELYRLLRDPDHSFVAIIQTALTNGGLTINVV